MLMVMKRNMLMAMGLVLAIAALGGCDAQSWTFVLLQTPEAKVQAVELTEISDAGAAADVVIDLTNPNEDVALPLPMARYTVTLGSLTYSSDVHPNATLPAGGTQRITLPAAVAGNPGDTYKVTGTISYIPPGEIRRLLTDMGVPLPWTTFNATGQITGDPARRGYIAPTPDEADPNMPVQPEPDDDDAASSGPPQVEPS